jgi:beta-N-acetylhexosaminidase
MRSLGITMDLAPVLDTASPSDPVADESDRSFSENVEVAAAYGLTFADGLLAGGVMPVGKHFPGFGHADANTDLGPATDPPLSRLVSNDLVPFEAAIAAGEPVIMVSHVAVPGLTGTVPASLSAATYEYLRGTLGFDGIATTDSLDAGAISAAGYSEPAAAVAAVEAGADMVMVGASSWPATLSALEQAVASGALPVSSVNASVDGILAAKGFAVCYS